jgi:hypothetical protein
MLERQGYDRGLLHGWEALDKIMQLQSELRCRSDGTIWTKADIARDGLVMAGHWGKLVYN